MTPLTKEGRIQARYVPNGYELDPRSTNNATVYVKHGSIGDSGADGIKPCARGFIGTSSKPAFNYQFRDIIQLETYLGQWFQDRLAVMEHKAERAAEKKAFKHTLKVGDILVNSWGYDQTNIDYYEVVDTTPNSNRIKIHQIAQKSETTGFMTGTCTPRPGQYVGKTLTKIVGEGNSVKIHKWGSWAYLWEGKENHWTSYA